MSLRIKYKNNGAILLIVLALIGFLLPVVGIFLSSSFSEIYIERNRNYHKKAYYLADSAIQVGIGFLKSAPPQFPDVFTVKPWLLCSGLTNNYIARREEFLICSKQHLQYRDTELRGKYLTKIIDESGKINLNMNRITSSSMNYDKNFLKTLLKNLYADVLKFSDNKSANTADETFEKPPDKYFQSIEQIVDVKNIDKEDFEKIKDYITVYSYDTDDIAFSNIGNFEIIEPQNRIAINKITTGITPAELVVASSFLHFLSNFSGAGIDGMAGGPLDFIPPEQGRLVPKLDDALDIIVFLSFLSRRNDSFINWILSQSLGAVPNITEYESLSDILFVPPLTQIVGCIKELSNAFYELNSAKSDEIPEIIKTLGDCDESVRLAFGASFGECFMGSIGQGKITKFVPDMPIPKKCPADEAQKSVTIDELKIIADYITVDAAESLMTDKANISQTCLNTSCFIGKININTASEKVLRLTIKSAFEVANLNIAPERIDFLSSWILNKRHNPAELWQSQDNGGVLGSYASTHGYPYFLNKAMLLSENQKESNVTAGTELVPGLKNTNLIVDGFTKKEYKAIEPFITVRSYVFAIDAYGELYDDTVTRKAGKLNLGRFLRLNESNDNNVIAARSKIFSIVDIGITQAISDKYSIRLWNENR